MTWKNILKQNRDNRENATGTLVINKDPTPNDLKIIKAAWGHFIKAEPSGPLTEKTKDSEGNTLHYSKWPDAVWRDCKYTIMAGGGKFIRFENLARLGLMTSFYNAYLQEQGKPEIKSLGQLLNTDGVNYFVDYVLTHHRDGLFYSKV
tara:strand:- start:257 stop:700 length:444 start_codon:yes stop_codon:yes gene_type:complete